MHTHWKTLIPITATISPNQKASTVPAKVELAPGTIVWYDGCYGALHLFHLPHEDGGYTEERYYLTALTKMDTVYPIFEPVIEEITQFVPRIGSIMWILYNGRIRECTIIAKHETVANTTYDIASDDGMIVKGLLYDDMYHSIGHILDDLKAKALRLTQL